MYLEHKRDQLIRKAVEDSAKPVNQILSQLRDDMDNIFSLEVITGAQEKLATLANAYNNDRSKLTFDQRRARLYEIKAAAAESAASVGSAPAGLVSAMMDAHNALVAEVQSSPKDKPRNLAALNTALEAWTTQIQTLAGQVNLLFTKRRNGHMIKIDTTSLSAVISQCFNYSTDGRFSPTQQSAFLADGKRLRGLLLNLLSAQFEDGTKAVLDANNKLTAVNAEISNSAAVLANAAHMLNDVATLVGNLDKLSNIAESFV